MQFGETTISFRLILASKTGDGSYLLSIVTSLSLGEERSFTSLVLGHLVESVLAARLSLAGLAMRETKSVSSPPSHAAAKGDSPVRATGLGNVNHLYRSKQQVLATRARVRGEERRIENDTPIVECTLMDGCREEEGRCEVSVAALHQDTDVSAVCPSSGWSSPSITSPSSESRRNGQRFSLFRITGVALPRIHALPTPSTSLSHHLPATPRFHWSHSTPCTPIDSRLAFFFDPSFLAAFIDVFTSNERVLELDDVHCLRYQLNDRNSR